jgi:hypothetical protein
MQDITLANNSPTSSLTIAASFTGLVQIGDATIVESKLGSIDGGSFAFVSGTLGNVLIADNSGDGDLSIAGFSGLAKVGSIMIEKSKLGSISGGAFAFSLGLGVCEDVTIINNSPPTGSLTIAGFTGIAKLGVVTIRDSKLAEIDGGFACAAGEIGDIIIVDNAPDSSSLKVVAGFTGQ